MDNPPIRVGDFVRLTSSKTGLLGHTGTVEMVDNLTAMAYILVKKGRKTISHKWFNISMMEIAVPEERWDQDF